VVQLVQQPLERALPFSGIFANGHYTQLMVGVAQDAAGCATRRLSIQKINKCRRHMAAVERLSCLFGTELRSLTRY
jgi:hypothetical protein